MHEFSLATSVANQLKEIAAQHGLKRAKKIVLKIGPFSHITQEGLVPWVDKLLEGTVLEGADVELVKVDPAAEQAGADTEVIMGDDIVIHRIQGEVEDDHDHDHDHEHEPPRQP